MTRLMLTTAAAAFAATAATASTQLEAQVEDAFSSASMTIDASQLSEDKLNELFLITTSTDDHGEQRLKIMSVLHDAGYATMEMGGNTVFVPINSLKAQVENGVESFGYEVDADTLDDAELAQLYIAVTSKEREEATAVIESVLQ
ncbi:MAG: hypothetical protein AAFQ79_12905 [Pseudomonadota bacterium]